MSSDLDTEQTQLTDAGFMSTEPKAANAEDPNRRIEELLQQQNDLMLRQIRLAEDSRQQSVQLMFQSSHALLKALDPSVRGIFKEWHAEFRSKVRVYVTQSQLLKKYRMAAASDELIAPFSDEAKLTWLWPESYLAHAQPVGEKGHVQPSQVYDLGAAFGELRRKHSEEAQAFVMAHQTSCVEQLSTELALSRQSEGLVQQVIAWAALHKSLFQDPSKAEQLLTQQAASFVELVYREEMSKAEKKIKEDALMMSPKLLLALRLLCVLATLLSSVSLEAENLGRLCAVLFALGCGMALFWEETFMQSTRALLGGLPAPWQLMALQKQVQKIQSAPLSRVPAEEVN